LHRETGWRRRHAIPTRWPISFRAEAIIALSSVDRPPLRLVLGSDACARAERTDEARLAELRAWRATSISTDFPVAQG
jgi:hypothetical protein